MTAAKPFYISRFQSDLLDLSRWLAAFLVVIEHLRSLMFADFTGKSHPGILGKFFYFITGFGHSAVMVFFVMSGFLVGGKVVEKLASGNFEWRKYAVDRISRLYAVYVLALLIGGALDYFGYHSFNRFGLYDETFPGQIAVINHNFHDTLTAPVFAVNLAMCQTILGPVFGSNGPLWSLANEFWYYVAGPLLFALVIWKKNSGRVFALVALALVIWFLPSYILIYGLVWLLGAMLYFVNGRALLPLGVSLILFVASFSLARLQWLKVSYLPDFLIGISFAAMINSAAGSAKRLPLHEGSKVAAGFSYSVYLCHFPFLVFVVSFLFQSGWIGSRTSPTPKLELVYGLILLLAYAWCYLISMVTEQQTPRIRAWLNGPFVSRILFRASTGSG